jgi:GTPase SAR1 family protein
VFALVITGPPGAGKTSVLEALSDQLVVDDVHHAVLETEALTSAHPPLDDEQWFAPVRAACDLYRGFGYSLLLVGVTVEGDDDLRRLLDAVGADASAVVRLEAEQATLRARIVEREPHGWAGLDALLAAATRLSSVIAGLDGIALALSTDGRRPQDVAERLREAFPDQLRPATGRAPRGA